MSKIAFSKLNIKANCETTSFLWNEQEIIVKHYLPIAEKVKLVSRIVNLSTDDNGFFNPMRVKVYLTVETMYAYTNLTFTPKAKEDALKLYDLFIGSGLFNSVIECIPAEEWKDLQDSVWETITNIYDYKNSVMGILEAINSDYNNLNLDATEIQAKLGDPENLALLKQILAKLG